MAKTNKKPKADKKPVFRNTSRSQAEVPLTLRQLDTILAALRRHQDLLEGQTPDEDGLATIAGYHGSPLSMGEIDGLADQLNSAFE